MLRETTLPLRDTRRLTGNHRKYSGGSPGGQHSARTPRTRRLRGYSPPPQCQGAEMEIRKNKNP